MITPIIGNIKVHTTNDRGHNVPELTEMLLDKIISVSETAPQPIKDQALQYRDMIGKVIMWYMETAVRNDRDTICQKLIAVGQTEAASLIKKI
jgi:inosine-uridine nucleoside N-ribohydrolase